MTFDRILPKCAMCGKEFPMEKLKKCPYCGQLFCEDDYPKHMAWEHRHEGLAEDEAKLWRERREISE
ncbi:MAG: hypothetical protein WB661_13215 [Candidatus Bathyarchaeia archaeon]